MFLDKDFRDKNICIMGLGYVGLTLATIMAEIGFQVLGVEIKDDVLEKLRRGEPHFFEPGLAERLKKVVDDQKIVFAKHIPEGYPANVYVITVGTPLDDNGRVRLDMVESVVREVSRQLKGHELVIMRSTVKLGTTSRLVRPILEEAQVPFDLAFCPERTLEGEALSELRHLPQIVGAVTKGGAVRAAQLFQFITPTEVMVSDAETAEMIKLIDNSQRDTNFAFANEVARICNAAGISALEVIKAGKLGYPRTNVLMPGLVGGPCLEKDPHILAEGLKEFGVEPEIIKTARSLNEKQPKEVVEYLYHLTKTLPGFPEAPTITLLGFAFKGKPATDDLRGTMAKPVLNRLKEYFPKANFRAFDPVVPDEAISAVFGLLPYPSLEEAMAGSHLVMILNNHPMFGGMPIERLAKSLAKPGLIYDFWNNFVAQDLHLPFEAGYIALGSHGKAVLPNRSNQDFLYGQSS
ncbi:MAG: nucleotide sugar dehydrogenase [Candidatus Pacebacteria bacterium]|nr:nucleotide sugar dehydrogenase [Candidatus Paceibacterota bacterium]